SLLPLPYQPTSVTPASGHWVLAPRLRVLFAPGKDTTKDLSYTATASIATPTSTDLSTDGPITTVGLALTSDLQIDTELPHPLPPALTQLAREVTAGTHPQYDAARALEQYFAHGHFTYDLRATVASGYVGLLGFLHDRHGYCEQFASAYVVLARALHMPARVAV